MSHLELFEIMPHKYHKAFKRSIYFPEGKGVSLFLAEQIGKKVHGKGINEIVADALAVYVRENFMFYWDKVKNE